MFLHLQLIHPATDGADFIKHIYRELNTEADKLSKQAVSQPSFELQPPEQKQFMQIYFDGSYNPDDAAAGIGVVIYASQVDDMQRTSTASTITAAQLQWQKVGQAAIKVKVSSSAESELAACCLANLMLKHSICFSSPQIIKDRTYRLNELLELLACALWNR